MPNQDKTGPSAEGSCTGRRRGRWFDTQPVSLLTFIIALLVIVCSFSSSFAGEMPSAPGRDGVFIHISHGTDSPHRLLMALKMAVTMAEGKKDVLVYCDIEAVKVLTSSAKDVVMEGFPTSHELLARLGVLKVVVLACPTCMKVAGIEQRELRTGVRVAERDLFFSFTKGRILSLDY
jgi:predicted peroxiredoxin